MLNHCFFCCQKSQKSNICVYVEPSATASATALTAVGAALAAVGATIATIAAAATAAVSVTPMIAISATAIAGVLSLIVVCLHRCLCFHLLPPLPAPAVVAVVCQRNCHCRRRCNCCPYSFCHHRHHHCLYFCSWLHCLYVSATAASVSVVTACHRFCFRCCCATASVSNAIATLVSATAAITDKKR
jgi:hypothetical protein